MAGGISSIDRNRFVSSFTNGYILSGGVFQYCKISPRSHDDFSRGVDSYISIVSDIPYFGGFVVDIVDANLVLFLPNSVVDPDTTVYDNSQHLGFNDIITGLYHLQGDDSIRDELFNLTTNTNIDGLSYNDFAAMFPGIKSNWSNREHVAVENIENDDVPDYEDVVENAESNYVEDYEAVVDIVGGY